MATSKLIQGDTLTETSNAADGFNPATEVSNYSYTSARVAKPVYNKYKASTSKPKVFGYYTDWSQYDGRLQGGDAKDNRGRGYDLTNVSPTAYDKIIVGFVGVTGFHKVDGMYRDVVAEAAEQCGKVKYEPTFLDPWGDFQSYVNVGHSVSGWDVDPKTVTQANTKGLLGGLRDLQAKAKQQGHDLVLSMSIGGWTMSNSFHETAASDSARKTFAKGVVKLFKQFPMLSEVDIDWEYPNAEGAGNPYGPEDGENYALLIGELRKQLDSAGLSNVKISIASSAVVKTFDYSNVKALLQAGLYGINVMTYDFFGTPWAETLTHHTNLNALEEGGWAVNTIVDHLLAEGFRQTALILVTLPIAVTAAMQSWNLCLRSRVPITRAPAPPWVPSSRVPPNGMTPFITTWIWKTRKAVTVSTSIPTRWPMRITSTIRKANCSCLWTPRVR